MVVKYLAYSTTRTCMLRRKAKILVEYLEYLTYVEKFEIAIL
jgi:hypothetical protein